MNVMRVCIYREEEKVRHEIFLWAQPKSNMSSDLLCSDKKYISIPQDFPGPPINSHKIIVYKYIYVEMVFVLFVY